MYDVPLERANQNLASAQCHYLIRLRGGKVEGEGIISGMEYRVCVRGMCAGREHGCVKTHFFC
jgi:hypothetical protein